ncbi:hypothetical protein GCM10007391_26570 [Alteromonas halophila]|uniref:Phosphoribosyltransferase domain-containing protein n=2 Tax=Alteromonas halophila TaxID=516698 RepID=A0A918N0V0_9ALTE|nr:hypothetical protein GCM10007391_26570 [Alteromonas halophila]
MAVPVIESWARRCGKGAQHTRNRHERLLAARDAFVLSNACLDSVLEKGAAGQCVAIVDDVLTTGVTVDVLAAKLRQRYPWLAIEVWVMAVTPAPGQRRLSLEKV